MSACDTARASYETSRSEVLERIRLRDNALLAFLGATGVIFGVATGATQRPQFLLILPYLSVAAAFIVTQHDRVIGCICAFITQDLVPFLREHGEDAPVWEACDLLKQYTSMGIIQRSMSHGVLILMPAFLALFWSWAATITKLLQFIWWCGLLVTIVSVIFLVSNHLERRRYYRQTSWRN